MRYSLRTRLLVLASCILLLGFSATAWIIDSAYRAGVQASIEDKLQVQILTLLSIAEPQGQSLQLPAELPDPRFNQLSSGLFALVLDGQGREVWRSQSSQTLDIGELTPVAPGQKTFYQQALADGSSVFVNGLGTVWEGEQSDLHFSFYVLENSRGFLESSRSFRNTLWQLLFTVAAVLLILQWWLLRWGLRPLNRVSKELKAVELGKNNRLVGDYPIELAPLTTNINHLIDSEQQQRQRYKDRMADLAHSLKTPLAVLNNLDDIAKSNQLEEVKTQVERMSNIVDYQLQRAVLGSQPLSFKRINIAQVIEQIKTALDKVYQDKNVHSQLLLDRKLLFRGDESDLTEMLANLMDNAYKYGAGEVRITLAKSDDNIEISIEDNGCGMSDAVLQQVLARGSRLDSQQQGQGIGMAVVNELVNHYRGTIKVSESDLLGACIKLVLP